jgi:hypothetical protein
MRIGRAVCGIGMAAAGLGLVACGGGGGGGGVADETADVLVRGRVVLASLAGATVEVFRHDDLLQPRATATTEAGPAAGRFELSLPGVQSTDLFLFVVRGGTATDVDEDGVPDPTPQDNAGVVHAVVGGGQLRRGLDVLVSVVSEVVYQRTRLLLAAEYPPEHVARAVAAEVTFVVERSLDGDADVDADDGLRFDPTRDASALFRPYRSYEPLVANLIEGSGVTQQAFAFSGETVGFREDPDAVFTDVHVVGDVVYVTDALEGLATIDLRTRARLDSFRTPGMALAFEVVDGTAVIADGTGLQTVDVTDPHSIGNGNRVALPHATALDVVGELAYVVGASPFGDDPSLHVMEAFPEELSSPLGSVPLDGRPLGVASTGSHAYVALGDAGLEVVDVRDPTAPRSLGTFRADADAYAVLLHRGHLFVGTEVGIQVFALTDPALPQALVALPLAGLVSADDLAAAGDRIFAATPTGIEVVDVSTPAAPVRLGALSPPGAAATAIAVDGARLAAAGFDGRLHVLAAGTPAPSAVVATLSVVGFVTCLDAEPGRARVGTIEPRAFHLVDLADPLRPSVLGSAFLPFSPRDVRARDGVAFVATDGLLAIDESDPAAPTPAGSTQRSIAFEAVALGSRVAFGVGPDGLTVVDVSAPLDPRLVSTVDIPGNPVDVAFDGGVSLVLANGDDGIATFDVTSEGSPQPAGGVAVGEAVAVAARRGFAFVVVDAESQAAVDEDDLKVLDVSVPTAPHLLRSVFLPGSPRFVTLSGDHALVGGGAAGLHVVDVSDPNASVHWGTLPVDGSAQQVAPAGDVVLVARFEDVVVVRGVRRAVP